MVDEFINDDEMIWYDYSAGVPYASVAEYGITLNNAAVKFFDNTNYIAIGANPKTLIIAIKKTTEDDSRRIDFASKNKKGYVRINCKDFIKSINPQLPENVRIGKQARRFVATWSNDILIVHLDQPMDDVENKES